MLLRTSADNRVQATQVIFIQFVSAIIRAAIIKTRFTVLLETSQHPINGRIMDVKYLGGLPSRTPTEHIENHQVPQPHASIAAPTQILPQALLDAKAQLKDNLLHGNSSRCQDRVLGAPITGEFPFSISDVPPRAADSRTVI
jgi:hypothetical protein